MTARFAGSRTLDDRRRRWLATNEAERCPVSTVEKPSPQSLEELAPKKANLRQFPIRKLISPKAWKIALTVLLAGGVGFVILVAGATQMPDPALMGPGWQRLIDASGGSLARLYQGGLLMLAGQLALLIWWGRSRSLRDFEGQYRIWLWAAFTLMAAGWSLVGNWHWAFSDTLCWLWSARFPQRDIVCWMFPAAFVAGIIWRKLCADMRECKSSHLLLWLTALCCVAAFVFRLGIDRTGWDPSTKRITGASLRMLASVGIFASFLAHARYVFHISAEPPEVRPTLWARLFEGMKVLVQKLPKPRLAFLKKLKRTPKPQGEKLAKKTSRSTKQKPQIAAEDSVTKATTKKSNGRKTTKPPEPIEPAAPTKAEPKVEAKVETKVERKPEPVKPAAPEKEPAQNPPAKASGGSKIDPPKQPAIEASPPPKKPLPDAVKPSAQSAPIKPAPEPPEPDQDEAEDDSSQPQFRVDPLDPGQLKGLSKKERRRLRKLHKDAQRQRDS